MLYMVVYMWIQIKLTISESLHETAKLRNGFELFAFQYSIFPDIKTISLLIYLIITDILKMKTYLIWLNWLRIIFLRCVVMVDIIKSTSALPVVILALNGGGGGYANF